MLANSGKGGGNGWDFEPSGLMLGYSGGPFGGGGGDRRSFKTGRNAAPGHAPPLMGDQYGQILAGSSVGVELAPMIDGNGNCAPPPPSPPVLPATMDPAPVDPALGGPSLPAVSDATAAPCVCFFSADGGNGYGAYVQPPPKLRAGNSFDTHPQL